MLAPVMRRSHGERVLVMMRWGFPPPSAFPQSQHVTNMRNTMSNSRAGWLQPRVRRLVPSTSFREGRRNASEHHATVFDGSSFTSARVVRQRNTGVFWLLVLAPVASARCGGTP